MVINKVDWFYRGGFKNFMSESREEVYWEIIKI